MRKIPEDHDIPRVSMHVSLIVTGYTPKRLNDIRDLLESVANQTHADLDVVFVGEGSRAICGAVESFARSIGLVKIEVLFNAGTPGLSSARNIGIRRAEGEILAFVDDDAILASSWAEALVETFDRNPSTIGVAGSAVPLWEDPRMAWFPKEFQWLVGCTEWFEGKTGQTVRNAWGANMAFRREAFANVMFDESLGGNLASTDWIKLGLVCEDTAFSLRVRKVTGRPIVYNPEVRVYHKVRKYRLTSRYLSRRAFWEGYTKAALHNQLGFDSSECVSLERALLRRILLKFFPQAVSRLLSHPSLALRQIILALDTLLYVTLGYASAASIVGRFTRSAFGK